MTPKLRRLAKTLGNSGSFKEAALKAGYAPSTAREQQSITSRKGFKEMLETYLPLDGAFSVTKEALKASKWNDFTGDREPDHNIRLKAADQHYKLHKVYSEDEDGSGGNLTVVYNFIEPNGSNNTKSEGDNNGSETLQDAQLAPEG